MQKVVFKCCLSGNVFYKKGDEVLLETSEASRLLKKGIVDFVDQKEEIVEDTQKQKTSKEDKKGKK
ncbi:hypothetical protein [Campylobacter sp. US33a]|uniref:hypothetical protein n=1 Tax=Campylobacter sp. US33a TaxID=2498120 RepID=UPI001067490F|nr:hypothetical protein [Campylobacter sp. US33a]TEY00364.1 hypothetical protein ELQ16_09280 [Campylobacter sp. US33a]